MPSLKLLARRMLALSCLPLAALASLQAAQGARASVSAQVHLADQRWVAAHAADLRRNALAALTRDPLDAPALAQLALTEKSSRAATAQLRAVERITRRNMTAQLLLIEVDARDGDIPGMLAHFDRILTATPELAPKVLPVLADTLADPASRAAVASYAARGWYGALLATAVARGADPAETMPLAEAATRQLPAERARDLSRQLAAQLVARGDYAGAKELAARLPGLGQALAPDLGFTAATLEPEAAPFAWTLANDEAVETAGRGGGIAISIAPTRTALAAERLTLLPPGGYRLTQQLAYDPAAPRAALRWDIRCAGGAPLWAGPAAPAAGAEFTVPAGCAAQQWRLTAEAADAQLPSWAWLTKLALAPK